MYFPKMSPRNDGDWNVVALLAMMVEESSKRLLLVPAFLAGVFHAGRAFFSRDAIWRAAFSASRLDAGIALLNDKRLARHGFTDQALGLFPHRLLRHPLLTCHGNRHRSSLITPASSRETWYS